MRLHSVTLNYPSADIATPIMTFCASPTLWDTWRVCKTNYYYFCVMCNKVHVGRASAVNCLRVSKAR